jgi:uncharacterized damage-inducible protein DinB
MSIQKSLSNEIIHETENTLRILKALPEDKWDYKPHPKSMSLGELANHVLELHGWVSFVFTKDSLDFHTDYVPSKFTKVDEMISKLEEMKNENLNVINNLSDENYLTNWTLKAGEHVIAELPKAAAYRFIVTNHLVHHRGQLTVYLRMFDVPVPGIYGPSADDKQ